MLVHWIWLTTRPHLSDRARLALLRHFQDAEELYFAPSADYDKIDELTPEARESLQDKSLEEAEAIMQECMEKDIHILTIQDAAYPRRLRNIPDPPPVLYFRGHLPDVDSLPTIAMVGTRKASAYGLSTAKRMGYQVAACGGMVISGLATGIDSYCMNGALTAGGTVIGVLGCGADVVYPRSNAGLYADTIRHGCLLTEFPPGTPPVRWNFPKRNRIISGLSCGVLVVEAPEKSGALITAHLAADQGRDVFVIPGNIDVPSGMGSNALLRQGAIAICSGMEILSEYEAQFPGKIHPQTQAYHDTESDAPAPRVAEEIHLPSKNPPSKTKKSKIKIDNGASTPYIDHTTIFEGLTEDEQSIVNLLQDGTLPMDEVIDRSGLTAGVCLASLTMLEVKGIVSRLPGQLLKLNTN